MKNLGEVIITLREVAEFVGTADPEMGRRTRAACEYLIVNHDRLEPITAGLAEAEHEEAMQEMAADEEAAQEAYEEYLAEKAEVEGHEAEMAEDPTSAEMAKEAHLARDVGVEGEDNGAK